MAFLSNEVPFIRPKFLMRELDSTAVVGDFLTSLVILFCKATSEEYSSDTLALRLSYMAIQG